MRNRAFVVLFIAMFVAMIGVGMVSPLLPIYVRDDLGGPAVAVALSFSGLAIAQIVSAPFVGSLGDRYGLKRFIVGGFAIYCVGAFGYLFADRWELVVFFRVLSGFGAAGVFPMTLAYIGRLSPPGGEGRYMGVFMVSQVTGFGVGPLLGGGVRDLFNSETAFFAMGIMLGATALGTFLLLPANARYRGPGAEEEEEEDGPALPWGQMVRRTAVVGSVLFMVLMALGWGAAFSFLAIFVVSADGLNLDSALFVGILLSSRQFMNALLQPLTGALADRFDRIRLVAVGLVLMGISQLLLPLVPGSLADVGPLTIAPWVLATVLIAGVGESLSMPSQQAIFVTLGRVVGMGSLMGLNNMAMSTGFLAGSLVGAAIVEWFGIRAVFVFAAGLMFAGMIFYVIVMSRARGELEEAQAHAARLERRDALARARHEERAAAAGG